MTKLYVLAQVAGSRLTRISSDEAGVVSFEYVIVASCIVAAVITAFGTGTGGTIATALTTAIGKITTALATVAA